MGKKCLSRQERGLKSKYHIFGAYLGMGVAHSPFGAGVQKISAKVSPNISKIIIPNKNQLLHPPPPPPPPLIIESMFALYFVLSN